jgi:hypothetical protein
MYESLSAHAENAFLRLKTDRKVPVFKDVLLGESGELELEKWVDDPLVADEYRWYVAHRS